MKTNQIINNITLKYYNFLENLKRNYSYSPKFLIVAFVIIFFFLIPYPQKKYSYKIGDIAKRDIRSPKNLVVFDKKATIEKINKKIEKALPVFDFNSEIISIKIKKVQNFFEFARKNLKTVSEDNLTKKIEEVFHYYPTKDEIKILKKYKFNENIEFAILKAFAYFMEKGVIKDNSTIFKYSDKGIILKNLSSGEKITKKDISSFYKYSKIKNILSKNFSLITDFHPKDKKLKKLIINLVLGLITPNIRYNKIEKENKIKKIKKSVHPVYYLIKKHEIIVREGEKINENILTKLNAIEKKSKFSDISKQILGILIFLILLGIFTNQILNEDINSKKIDLKDAFFILCSLVFTAVFFRLFIGMSLDLLENTVNISKYLLLFMIPYSLPVILVTIVLRGKYSYLMTLFVCLFCFFIYNEKLLIFSLFCSLFMIKKYKCCLERITFFKLGLELGIANIIIISAIKLFFLNSSFFSSYTYQEFIGGFLGGILTSLFVLGIIPVIEILFKYTTDLRLIELGNLEHPLLKEFFIKAPGSYHHSMIVGNLAEAAAEEIGANPLLARVGAYYHDIGKMKKPQYFIENADPKENKHEKLTPFMSALILISHIKEGVELVEKYKIGDEIIDIIKQHHGTSLIKYFYNKALELKKKGLKEDIDEKDFRYPGPKPQTKEAGIVMLADIVEASSRTLQHPTPARIKGLVKNLVDSVYNDGQLDECELTLKDLTKIKETFTKILLGIFHQRIEYPDDKDIQRNRD